MQRVVVRKPGDVSRLEFASISNLKPGPGEVLLRVEASGVNFADLVARMGMYQDAPPFPMGLGYEVAGVVEELGANVDPQWMGVPVVSLTQFTGYASHVVVPVSWMSRRPESMSAAVGASIPVTGLTAWMMLEVMGRVREGDRVLVHSAGGGVGLMALDLILRAGAVAVGTASAHKHAFLKERGYAQLIDYRTEDYAEVLADETGFDLVLDPVGGASWAKGMQLLRTGGRLVMFGFSAQNSGQKGSFFAKMDAVRQIPWLKFNPVHLINQNIGVMGVNMARLWDEGDRVSEWLSTLMELWASGTLRPVVHCEVPFQEVQEAHRILHDRENIGKVVLMH